MSDVVDSQQRRRAIDPQQSFCVTAPACWGKTERLIQRYLAMWSLVSSHERGLASSCTRQAAGDRRQCIA